LAPGGDLWRHAPARDAAGRPVSDLMMLLPGIRRGGAPATFVREQLRFVLQDFGDRVLFADLNLRLGVLWVSVRGEAGLNREVIEAIRARIAGARVVGHYPGTLVARKLPWWTRVKRLFLRSNTERLEGC
jgi:hypothetical protein